MGGGECDVSKDVTIMTIWSAAAAFDKKAKIADFGLAIEFNTDEDLREKF